MQRIEITVSSEGDGFMRGSPRTTCERNIQTKFHQFIKAIIKT
jgi:hypothetical protein